MNIWEIQLTSSCAHQNCLFMRSTQTWKKKEPVFFWWVVRVNPMFKMISAGATFIHGRLWQALKVARTSWTRLRAGWRMLAVLMTLARAFLWSATLSKTCDVWRRFLMCLLRPPWSAFAPPPCCSMWGRPCNGVRTEIVSLVFYCNC